MKDHSFFVELDEKTGFITSIVAPHDPHHMNWCADTGTWGRLKSPADGAAIDAGHIRFGRYESYRMSSFTADDDSSACVYENNRFRVTVQRGFRRDGTTLFERFTVKNISPTVVCLNRDTFGIELPFNDRYTYADDCMVHRCNTHIWCGGNTSWVNALKMGDSDLDLGLVLTKGAFVSYSQMGCDSSNTRGSFIFEPETVLLKRDEEYTLEWELFWHSGKRDFFERLSEYPTYIGISAEHYTVFEGERIRFTVTPHNGCVPSVTCRGDWVEVTERDGAFEVEYTPECRGEHIFKISCGDVSTYAEFMVKLPFAELTERRVHFIVEHQQCLDEESPLYGAYLIYDNKTSSPFFDFYNSDHNACRERMNMPLTLIRYLQLREDERVRRSVDLFIDFMFREFYEERTGEVFNNIGKTADCLRLYNAPGVMLILAEMFLLTREQRYIDNIVMLAEKYYSIGGEKCYSNAVAIRKVMQAMTLAEREDYAERSRAFFKLHTDVMLRNGVSYPKHEVNYEQTIVTPAVTCISEMGLYSDDREGYIERVQPHLECLDRFIGEQPSFHLNEISIRYWDGYWFGKAMQFGDTLPHHLSCLSARSMLAYARLSGDGTYIRRAEECIRNCLCLIDDDGRGHAAYLYPHTINGVRGEFYDEWANDQDLPLYDAMNACDLIPAFSIGS